MEVYYIFPHHIRPTAYYFDLYNFTWRENNFLPYLTSHFKPTMPTSKKVKPQISLQYYFTILLVSVGLYNSSLVWLQEYLLNLRKGFWKNKQNGYRQKQIEEYFLLLWTNLNTTCTQTEVLCTVNLTTDEHSTKAKASVLSKALSAWHNPLHQASLFICPWSFLWLSSGKTIGQTHYL